MELKEIFPQFDGDLLASLQSKSHVVHFEEGADILRPGHTSKTPLSFWMAG